MNAIFALVEETQDYPARVLRTSLGKKWTSSHVEKKPNQSPFSLLDEGSSAFYLIPF